MIGVRISSLLALLVVACHSGSPALRESETDAGPLRLSEILGSSVDSLSGTASKLLCEEDARRFDACAALGMKKRTESDCNDAVAACRGHLDGGVPAACDGASLGPVGSCSVSVSDYLACVTAWDSVETCANAGKYVAVPEPCRALVSHCPRFASEFSNAKGTPPPCAADTGEPARAESDVYGYDGCRPAPARFVVLGDSIASCYAVDAAHCGPLLIADYVKKTVAPNLVVESHAEAGALIGDLPAQAREVSGGPGPLVVWIYILGNDLAAREVDYDATANDFSATFDYFSDTARFPGGVTFLLNTQYSPYDQCPNPLGGRASASAAADEYLQTANRRVFIALALDRPDTVTVDQYPDWLGHGDNADVAGCPHCGRDNTSWMSFDGIHPNALGYAHMAAKWDFVVDEMYGARCHGG